MVAQGLEMDRMDTYKYPDVANNQAGLEVGDDPYSTSQAGWPDPAHPVWGPSDPSKAGAASVQTPSAEKFHVWSGDGGRGTGATRRILGLSVGVFWALVVLLFCIIAAGVGGGVGAGLASRKSSCPTDPISTPTPASAPTGSSTFAPDTSPSPAPTSLCSTQTDFNGTIITPNDSTGNSIILSNAAQKFQVLCNTNFVAPSSEIHNIMKIWTVDLTACVSQCAEYNAGLENLIFSGTLNSDGGGSGFCRAVSLALEQGEFCYLKNGTGTGGADTTSAAKKVASAVLVTNTP